MADQPPPPSSTVPTAPTTPAPAARASMTPGQLLSDAAFAGDVAEIGRLLGAGITVDTKDNVSMTL